MELTLKPVICAAVLAFVLLRLYYRRLRLSAVDKLPGPGPSSRFFGNLPDLIGSQGWRFWQHVSATYGPVTTLRGIMGPLVLLSDPRALHTILIKDVDLFPKNVEPTLDDFGLFLGPGVLTTEGAVHRRQRKMLNPVFSVAHLRHMTGLFYNVAHQMQRAMALRIDKDSSEIDVNGWMGRTTLEMLGQAGLGYSFDDFSGDAMDDYGESLKMFFPAMNSLHFVELFIQPLSYYLSRRKIRTLFRAFPSSQMRQMLDIVDLVERRSLEIIDEKRTALKKGDQELIHRVGEGKDIMSILLRANMAASESEKLSDEELVAQMSTFILAGMDTTSNGLSRVLQVLSQHPEAQEKLRAEIVQAQGGSAHPTDIEHDELVKLPYLDAVCRETLRLHAPVPIIGRVAAKNVVIPLSAPIRTKDGRIMNEITVPAGVRTVLNLQASNCNKALWGEDALEWRPERWLEPPPGELEEARIPGVYSHLMTFSGGTRSCVGFKFSQLEMKVVLAVLIASFKFELTEKPIAWNSAPVLYPTMGQESTKPELLLTVSLL